MTEKDFRRLVTELEITESEKEKLNNQVLSIKTLIQNNISDNFTFIDCLKGGSLVKGTMLPDTDQIDLLLVFKNNVNKAINIVNLALLNEIENILIYNQPEINRLSDLTIIASKNIIKVNLEHYIVNLMIRYVDEDIFNIVNDEKQIRFTEFANRDYTYFRNTMLIIKYYRDSQQLKISGYQLEILLYYSLNEYFNGNRYESYINGFMKAIDDFTNYKRIDISNDIYQKLDIEKKEAPFKKGYTIVDFTNQAINLTSEVNDVTINEYRKLKKVLSKLIDNVQVVNASSMVVSLDINPLLDEQTNTYCWSYRIINTNIYNKGGSYLNNQDEYYTAILKGFYKGLRAIIDNNLNRHGIELICQETNLFKKAVNYSDENKSRVKTLQAYIETNNITFKN